MQRSKIQRELDRSVIAFVDAVQAGGKSVSLINKIYSAHRPICTNEHPLTMQAHEKTVLVKDLLRNAATFLRADERVTWIEVRAVNEESIYNHSAFVEVTRSKPEGRNLE